MQIINPLEGGRVCGVLVAQAAFQLRDRVVFMAIQPVIEFAFYHREVLGPLFQQGAAQMRDVGAGEQHLQRVLSSVNAAGGGERQLHAAVQDGDPAHRQAGLGGGRQLQAGRDLP